MILKDVLDKSIDFFKKKGIESARLDSELLIAEALHWQRIDLYLKYDCILTEAEVSACREYIRRRGTGEPVAYILGFKDFYKSRFMVNPNVLIPRPETEFIVERSLEFLRSLQQKKSSPLRILDLGSGSGCIGLSIISEVPSAQLVAVDISSAAIAVAQENANQLGLRERVDFVLHDAASFIEKWDRRHFDLVVANPPYIDVEDQEVDKFVREFEPHVALFAENQGLAAIQNWVQTVGLVTHTGALVIFEIGALQGPAASQVFKNTAQFTEVAIVKDYAKEDRFITAQKI